MEEKENIKGEFPNDDFVIGQGFSVSEYEPMPENKPKKSNFISLDLISPLGMFPSGLNKKPNFPIVSKT